MRFQFIRPSNSELMAANLITHRALPTLYGMTREMFTPIFVTLFGREIDFIPEVEKWFNGKTEI